MATWVEVGRGDSFLAEIVAVVGENTSLSWPGIAIVAHAWLEFESGSWVAVYAVGDMNEAIEKGGHVQTTAYLASSAKLLSFDRRLRAPFRGDHTEGKAHKWPEALAAVSTEAREAFRIS